MKHIVFGYFGENTLEWYALHHLSRTFSETFFQLGHFCPAPWINFKPLFKIKNKPVMVAHIYNSSTEWLRQEDKSSAWVIWWDLSQNKMFNGGREFALGMLLSVKALSSMPSNAETQINNLSQGNNMVGWEMLIPTYCNLWLGSIATSCSHLRAPERTASTNFSPQVFTCMPSQANEPWTHNHHKYTFCLKFPPKSL